MIYTIYIPNEPIVYQMYFWFILYILWEYCYTQIFIFVIDLRMCSIKFNIYFPYVFWPITKSADHKPFKPLALALQLKIIILFNFLYIINWNKLNWISPAAYIFSLDVLENVLFELQSDLGITWITGTCVEQSTTGEFGVSGVEGPQLPKWPLPKRLGNWAGITVVMESPLGSFGGQDK